jgi:hypothetical protein
VASVSRRAAACAALCVLAAPPAAPAGADVPTPTGRARKLCPGSGKKCQAWLVVEADGRPRDGRPHADTLPSGYGPIDLAQAYGIDPAQPPPAGSAATIAVVDAFGYPSLEADLATYRAAFGLPACTSASGCLAILDQSGLPAPLPSPGTGIDGTDWQVETALDLEMASALCPSCKLMAMEADDDVDDGLDLCNDAAVAAGATVVSNSWSDPEGSAAGVNAQNTHYDHPGVAIFAATGDSGEGRDVGMPATSPLVIAVGGTTLDRDTTATREFTETAWSDAGSLCSSVFPAPPWQTGTACTTRAVADTSAVADPATGVAVFFDGMWLVVGGTSVASPVVASIFVMTGHAAVGPDYIWTNPTFFNDIDAGANGSCSTSLCNAGRGWDGPTGLGTPIGALLDGAKLPTLSVAPAEGAQVEPGFEVTATCTSNDAATITEVDIGMDGFLLGALHAPPFTQQVPTTFVDGTHQISVRCATSALATVGATVDVTQGSAGSVTTSGNHDSSGCSAATGASPWLALALVTCGAGARRPGRRRAARAPQRHRSRRP